MSMSAVVNRGGHKRVSAEVAAALLTHKLRSMRFPEHGKVTFEFTLRGGMIERPRLLLDDSDDERWLLAES